MAVSKTNLCINNHEALLNVFCAQFEERGYKLLTAATGKEALELLRQKSVNVVVLDYHVSNMSYGTALQVVKRVSFEAPVLMLSGRKTIIPRDVRNATT